MAYLELIKLKFVGQGKKMHKLDAGCVRHEELDAFLDQRGSLVLVSDSEHRRHMLF